jgi:hypothetical protein
MGVGALEHSIAIWSVVDVVVDGLKTTTCEDKDNEPHSNRV